MFPPGWQLLFLPFFHSGFFFLLPSLDSVVKCINLQSFPFMVSAFCDLSIPTQGQDILYFLWQDLQFFPFKFFSHSELMSVYDVK